MAAFGPWRRNAAGASRPFYGRRAVAYWCVGWACVWGIPGCGDGVLSPVVQAPAAEAAGADVDTGAETAATDSATADSATQTDTGDSAEDTVVQDVCSTDAVSVGSLQEMATYFDQDGVRVRLEPGTYTLDTGAVEDGWVSGPDLLPITGSGSAYCFTGARILVDTALLSQFGAVFVSEVALRGDDSVLDGLTIEDVGDQAPAQLATDVLVAGVNNRVENLHLTVRGSYPYGYGEVFGHGANPVIPHRKHIGVTVQGEGTRIAACTIIHRAFGHGIYLFGALNTEIDGCYIEGEVRTTDDILAEEGTGSPADQVDFMTAWGYRLPPGYVVSLQSSGISASNTGPSEDPNQTRYTGGVRVLRTTVKYMSSGINIGFANDEKYVEDCEVRGCTYAGYVVGTEARVVASRGDVRYAPVYVDNYDHDRGNVVELTVIDEEPPVGNITVAYIAGSEHDIVLHGPRTPQNADMVVKVAGLRGGVAHVDVDPTYDDLPATDITVRNETGFAVQLGEKSSGCTGVSAGPVLDHGVDNAVNYDPNL